MFKPKVGILLIVKLKVRRFLIFWLNSGVYLYVYPGPET
jgi:hypothetical protein